MFMLWRSCRRTVLIPAKSLYIQAVQPVMDLPPSVNVDSPWTHSPGTLCMEGFQGEIQDVSISEAKRLFSKTIDHTSQDTSVQGIQAGYSSPSTESVGHFSYSGLKRSTEQDLYTVRTVPQYGQSRHFTTSAVDRSSSVQGAQQYEFDHHLEDPTPQGIQGDDCIRFKLWMENCQRYSLPNCDEQMQALRTGRKTLAEVFLEQQQIIEKVAEDWRKRQQVRSKLGQINAQGVQEAMYNFEFNDMISDNSPQGLQGDDCANYKVWLHNCKAMGFGDCAQQLQSVREGQKTLQDIFDEQDQLIRKIVKDYQQRRTYSTSSKSEVRSSGSSTDTPSQDGYTFAPKSTPSSDGENNLSQKDKLKRAVKEYGGTVIIFHIGISLISLGGFYLAVSSGIDVVGLLTRLGVGEAILGSKIAAGSTTFVIAYAVHKVFAPVRIGITLTCAPLLVRHLRKIGFLKPPKPKSAGTAK